MDQSSKINEYIQSLKSSERMGHQVVHHRKLSGNPPVWSKTEPSLSADVTRILKRIGIPRLFKHQVEAIRMIQDGIHVVVSTPTASGKTLIYNLPVIDRILRNPKTTSLYFFPLKALAQDQLKTFEQMASLCDPHRPTAAIYDGDTSAYQRKKIRENPPDVLLTNPEMVHLSILAHHRKWAAFLQGLETVVIDEVHTYRGIFGSHMAQVIRRLRRVCSRYGASPTFVFSSATIGNPSALAEQLSGLRVKAITRSGAPRGKRHVVFINPDQSPAHAAILLLKAALHRRLRTIAYTQSRKMTELIAMWASTKAGVFQEKIRAYRAGLLPEERRDIEGRLASGNLLAVVSTSALELGIDIGDLDLCILVGYPGTLVSTVQRGGRVGRSGQDAALIMIAGEDALDQYFLRHPEKLIDCDPEDAVVNPENTHIMEKHLVCAAAELPIGMDDPIFSTDAVKEAILRLEARGELLRDADGGFVYSKRKAPHRDTDLRGGGHRYRIVCRDTGKIRGEIDAYRVFREAHPGAVYLHQGRAFLVEHLDLDTRTVTVSETPVDYYTKIRSDTDIEILEIHEEKTVYGTVAYAGKVKVTDRITGYEKWRIHARKMLGSIPLALPPQVFETDGLWFQIPHSVQQAAESAGFDFLGGIHAVEHAAIGIFPLLIMADRNDLGGVATPFHPQVGSGTIFIYDGIPGGAGITRSAYNRMCELLDWTLETIDNCPCESGCPACVHSPKCGSGNRPIDKQAGAQLLRQLKKSRNNRKATGVRKSGTKPDVMATPAVRKHPARIAIFDIETQRSAKEVGGWHRADRMRISCAVLYDTKQERFSEFNEDQALSLIDRLKRSDLVVGFNIKRFDYQVLSRYSDFDFSKLHSLDILEEVHDYLGFRLSLDHLAQATLSVKKTADGLQALEWWRQGRIKEILAYCRVDVEITRDLYQFGRQNGYLLFNSKMGVMRIPVDW
jgi:DEAD/DEAH box helicase domain-containing protein